ncbi:nuclear transport factor 2 family protein [Sphingomonas hankyongi]|uniref:Nuclear transport factor 2 family protein n=1 Tax=Sphingomonas hankyongi TaxID=2908209 RepID=A0ABT0RZD8_9SPHN|nr:nuclear transport factor 2 family protein [Sphingomonas hankyongi]MCL6728970.1 nuclear transport factor 2 family protein [Sphingomonas hankyongi]
MSTSRIRLLTICAASSMFVIPAPAAAADDPRVAGEIIALARSQWAAEIAGQPAAQQMSQLADDYTEFNGDYPTRIDGKDLAVRMGEVAPYAKPVLADMSNAKVQVYGDTAILTYNYTGMTRSADGKVNPSVAKSTRVYVKQGGQWRLVHANFAPVVPPQP